MKGLFTGKLLTPEPQDVAKAPPPPPPVDPLKQPHVVINGPKAVKCFDLLTRVQNDRDLGARCRLWQMIQAEHPETREGRWEIAVGLVDLIVYRKDAEAVDSAEAKG